MGTEWIFCRRMKATRQGGRQGHSKQRWLRAPQCSRPRCWRCHEVTGAPWRLDRPQDRTPTTPGSRSRSWLHRAGGRRGPRWGTHTQMATRQTVGLGFQAMLFTTPPTGSVFMQRAVHTSQNRTVQSSEPAGHRGGGPGQAWLPQGTPRCHGLARGGRDASPGRREGQPRAPLAAFGEEPWQQQEGGCSAPAPAIPHQLLGTTAAPAPRRRDVTGGCCGENRPPPRSPSTAALPVVPS